MKQFFKSHSYDMVKMFLNQFATAIFGCALALAAAKAQNPMLRNVTSVFAILFYLFLLYTMTWDIGFREKVSVDSGRIPRKRMKGALIALCANSLNFLLAIFILLSNYIDWSFIGTLGGISGFCALLLEGMYIGVLANTIGGVAISSFWWVWFLTPLPAIVTCGIAYNAGLHDFKLTAPLTRKMNKRNK